MIGNGGDGLRFKAQRHPFLGFDGLMQAVAVTTPFHDAARELVHDKHFIVTHHVFVVAFEKMMGLEGLLDHVDIADVLVGIEVVHAQQPFTGLHALIGKNDVTLFLILGEMVVYPQLAHHLVHAQIHIR